MFYLGRNQQLLFLLLMKKARYFGIKIFVEINIINCFLKDFYCDLYIRNVTCWKIYLIYANDKYYCSTYYPFNFKIISGNKIRTYFIRTAIIYYTLKFQKICHKFIVEIIL